MTDKPSNILPFRNGAGRSWYAVKASTDEAPAVVEVYDEIGGWGISARQFIDEIQALDGEGKVVEIRLNSPGGDVFEGVAIATALGRMKAQTVAVVDGLAASIASLIAVSCDLVKMPSNAMMMIHSPWVMSVGSADELRATAEVLDKIEAQLVAAYDAKADRTLGADRENRESAAEMVKAETWLTADECIALGYADELLNPVAIAASVRPDFAAKFMNEEAAAPFILAEEIEAEADTAENEEAAEIEAEAETETPEQTDGEEAESLSAEDQAAIVAACSMFDMKDKAPGFIEARASFEDVRAALFAARAAADEAIETDATQPVVEEPVAAKTGGISKRASALKNAQGRN